MTKEKDAIDTSAEHAENAVLPMVHEVHTDPSDCTGLAERVPAKVTQNAQTKSPAQWAYERLILYIQNFEEQLDNDHEIGLGFVGGGAGVMRIEGMGYFDPDIVTFYGTDPTGARTQVIQHVSQLNVTLRASPKHIDQPEAVRIGFQLARDLEEAEATS